MSRLLLLTCIGVLCLQVVLLASSQENDCEFIVDPMDETLEVNDTNITLNCMSALEAEQAINWEIYLRDGTFWTVSGADVEVQRLRGYEWIPVVQSLKIIRVQTFHAGIYRCRGRGFHVSPTCIYYSDNATITVRGPAEVEIFGDPSFLINTTKGLNISGTVNGQPDPNVTLCKVENGQEVLIDDSRITIEVTEATKLMISIKEVRVSDSGIYRVKATNEVGGSSAEFSVTTRGPDRPNIRVPKVVVTGINQRVNITCSVQSTASVDGFSLQLNWIVNGTVVQHRTSSSIMYVTQESDFSVTLFIPNVTHFGDRAICEASNIRSMSRVESLIYIPPAPQKPTIKGDGSKYTISWTHLGSNEPVVNVNYTYIINIVEAGTDKLVASYNVDVTSGVESGSSINYTVGNLPAGEYDVRLITVGRTEESKGMSTPSRPARFRVRANDSVFTTIIGSVGGSVGVVILIAVGIFVGAFFLCFYSHRRQLNSQQQRWGSEEDKVDSAVPNTYTTLALGNSELPPSPSTPLISSFFSTEVDPKWEFPRENIQLKDVLHEGQFTILYKGTVKGIKERMIDVAIKSVRDDANEDDVKALVSEMETLAGLGAHPNIVSLVRVCTVGSPMYVVMEYMCHGDLLGFLRASRGHHGLYHISPGTRYQPPTLNLCSRDLLNVAMKIANGMQYLSDRKIVHRTLCAKNVLVGPGMDIKIYNVGSFDVSFESRDYYMKWMAPETLFDHTTTTYSDVWSYGITLWELVTVGGAPYAEILPEDLYTQLHSGMRMPKPQHCAQEVYDIMWQCWQRNPTDRPHFAVIHETLEELLESKISYLDLRQYKGYVYSQFDDAPAPLSTAL